MLDISIFKFFIVVTALAFLVFLLVTRSFGIVKLAYLNFKWLRGLKSSKLDGADITNQEALTVTINHCKVLNSKWILDESDLNLTYNTHQLIKEIARAYYPNSKFPLEEARIRCVLNAFMQLKNHLLVLTTWQGTHPLTQFRIRHIVILSRAWKLKESWKDWKVFAFLNKHKLYPLFKWLFFIIRCVDLTFWVIRMVTYILQDIVFKVFLVRWYLIVGKLAIQVYSNRTNDPEIQFESILNDLGSIPEFESKLRNNLPEKIKRISEVSRNEILYHTWRVEWIKVKEIYINLTESIARDYHPASEQPIYEVKLSDLLASGVYFAEQIATIQTYPFLNKILDLRIAHALMTKDTADFLTNNQVLAWVNKHKLTYIFKYSLLLFKAIQRKHPALLFKDFAFTLAGEGCKRWFYLYLHDRITIEINALYRESKNPQ